MAKKDKRQSKTFIESHAVHPLEEVAAAALLLGDDRGELHVALDGHTFRIRFLIEEVTDESN